MSERRRKSNHRSAPRSLSIAVPAKARAPARELSDQLYPPALPSVPPHLPIRAPRPLHRPRAREPPCPRSRPVVQLRRARRDVLRGTRRGVLRGAPRAAGALSRDARVDAQPEPRELSRKRRRARVLTRERAGVLWRDHARGARPRERGRDGRAHLA